MRFTGISLKNIPCIQHTIAQSMFVSYSYIWLCAALRTACRLCDSYWTSCLFMFMFVALRWMWWSVAKSAITNERWFPLPLTYFTVCQAFLVFCTHTSIEIYMAAGLCAAVYMRVFVVAHRIKHVSIFFLFLRRSVFSFVHCLAHGPETK